MTENQRNESKNLGNVFFDIHCHAMNLSHPGLLAFLNRVLRDHGLNFGDITELNLLKIFKSIFAPFKKQIIGLFVFIAVYFLMKYETASISATTGYLSAFSRAWHLWLEKVVVIGLIAAVIIYLIYKKKVISERLTKIFNLLSVMDNDIGSMFIHMEEDLIEAKVVKKPGDASDDGKKYDRAIITPLVMDFGSNRIRFETKKEAKWFYYDEAPHKPVIEQVVDLLDGISDYRKRSKYHILEIYPFLGLNTKNYKFGTVLKIQGLSKDIANELCAKFPQIYSLEKCDDPIIIDVIDSAVELEISDFLRSKGLQCDIAPIIKKSNKRLAVKESTLSGLLNKYFGEYKRNSDNYSNLSNNFSEAFPVKFEGKYDGSIENVDDFYFAGVKLYPPLGFDPWPDASEYNKYENYEEEFYKVNYLYEFCQKRGIPITFHCTGSGFKTSARAGEYANPDKWKNVIETYGELKINFAHFGVNDEADNPFEWTTKIIELMKKHKNVYADFSFKGAEEGFYSKFLELINREENKVIKDRLLFGSDFMIVLSQIYSYKDYLEKFRASGLATSEEIFCSANPKKFLFAEAQSGCVGFEG